MKSPFSNSSFFNVNVLLPYDSKLNISDMWEKGDILGRQLGLWETQIGIIGLIYYDNYAIIVSWKMFNDESKQNAQNSLYMLIHERRRRVLDWENVSWREDEGGGGCLCLCVFVTCTHICTCIDFERGMIIDEKSEIKGRVCIKKI